MSCVKNECTCCDSTQQPVSCIGILEGRCLGRAWLKNLMQLMRPGASARTAKVAMGDLNSLGLQSSRSISSHGISSPNPKDAHNLIPETHDYASL